jgi:hypothetical protein
LCNPDRSRARNKSFFAYFSSEQEESSYFEKKQQQTFTSSQRRDDLSSADQNGGAAWRHDDAGGAGNGRDTGWVFGHVADTRRRQAANQDGCGAFADNAGAGRHATWQGADLGHIRHPRGWLAADQNGNAAGRQDRQRQRGMWHRSRHQRRRMNWRMAMRRFLQDSIADARRWLAHDMISLRNRLDDAAPEVKEGAA